MMEEAREALMDWRCQRAKRPHAASLSDNSTHTFTRTHACMHTHTQAYTDMLEKMEGEV